LKNTQKGLIDKCEYFGITHSTCESPAARTRRELGANSPSTSEYGAIGHRVDFSDFPLSAACPQERGVAPRRRAAFLQRDPDRPARPDRDAGSSSEVQDFLFYSAGQGRVLHCANLASTSSIGSSAGVTAPHDALRICHSRSASSILAAEVAGRLRSRSADSIESCTDAAGEGPIH
jgi:hypothetical protein